MPAIFSHREHDDTIFVYHGIGNSSHAECQRCFRNWRDRKYFITKPCNIVHHIIVYVYFCNGSE